MSTLHCEYIHRGDTMLSDQAYMEMIERASHFNRRLLTDRQTRLPFLDSQTGIAQSNCHLWQNTCERYKGKLSSQMYSYPARRWKKKKKSNLWNDVSMVQKQPSVDDSDALTIMTVENPSVTLTPLDKDELVSVSSVDTKVSSQQVSGGGGAGGFYNAAEESSRMWIYDEYDEMMIDDPPDAGEIDDADSDGSEYDEKYGHRKKKKKPAPRGRGKKKTDDKDDLEHKPYVCDLCGARYKTRPGLSYHFTHQHTVAIATTSGPTPTSNNPSSSSSLPSGFLLDDNSNDGSGGSNKGRSSRLSSSSMTYNTNLCMSGGSVSIPVTTTTTAVTTTPSPATPSLGGSSSISSMAGMLASVSAGITAVNKNEMSKPSCGTAPSSDSGEKKSSKTAHRSPYCDFCMGDASNNKKTGQSEELVSCGDCGRSGHPSCLQFTENMIISVKKYSWQCIECKSCGLCGTSDNDDQLLFCDDCDRGYHMYCLNPPLSAPPEGSWSCHLCIKEFGSLASIHQPVDAHSQSNGTFSDRSSPRYGSDEMKSRSALPPTSHRPY